MSVLPSWLSCRIGRAEIGHGWATLVRLAENANYKPSGRELETIQFISGHSLEKFHGTDFAKREGLRACTKIAIYPSRLPNEKSS
jgi:hypothetical protein